MINICKRAEQDAVGSDPEITMANPCNLLWGKSDG